MPETTSQYYDRLEVRDPEAREAALFHALPGLLRHAIERAPGFAAHLEGVDVDAVISREALAELPILSKFEMLERKKQNLPFGGLNATPLERLARIYVSPGPIYDPEGNRADYWRFARSLFAAGFRPGDMVHNAFSYHMTPGGSMLETGARALGCPVIAAGTGQTDLQLRVIADLRPVGYVGTPSFLRILLDRAAEQGVTPSFRKALVTGEAFPPPLRDRLKSESRIDAYQCYGTADLGLVAYESVAREGLIVDEGVLIEIVRPGTGDPVPDGEVGEVVVTVFNSDYPLIRYATGDLSAVLPGPSPCGRTGVRIKGWMGRADQTIKVRGMFVLPSQIAEVQKQHAEVMKARLTVSSDDGHDRMVLACEVRQPGEALEGAIAETVREMTGLRGKVEFVAPGALPNDGKVIDDLRPAH
jgi:phenylacetate-CoA ligase